MRIDIRHVTPCYAPAPAAWAVLMDLPRWPEWYPHVASVRRLDRPSADEQGGGAGPGSLWEEGVRRGPFVPRFRLTILDRIEGERLTWEARYLFVTGRHSWIVRPVAAGCELHDAYTFTGPAPVMLLARAVFRIVRLRATGQRQIEARARRAETLAAKEPRN